MTNALHAPILRRIDRFLRRADMTMTAFGLAVANNGYLVQRIRDGNVSSKTLLKVTEYLDLEESRLKDVA